jgi:RimJ/RimL family protein N-acetyltransferase
VWDRLVERLEGRVVALEPLEPRHVDRLRTAAAFPEIWEWAPIDASTDFDRWFAYARTQQQRGEEAPFATVRSDTGEAIGSTRFLALRPEHRSRSARPGSPPPRGERARTSRRSCCSCGTPSTS